MSNRTLHNIKSTGQGFIARHVCFSRHIEDFSGATPLANIQFGPKPYMREDVYAPSVTVRTRKHRSYTRDCALHGELGARISS